MENILWKTEETCSVLLQRKEFESKDGGQRKENFKQNQEFLKIRGFLQSSESPITSNVNRKWKTTCLEGGNKRKVISALNLNQTETRPGQSLKQNRHITYGPN